MKRFLEWLELHESVSVYVSGYEYNDNVNNLDDISYQLNKKLIYPAFNKLSPEQQDIIAKAGPFPHQTIVPDGSYYSDKTEMINFYPDGWGDLVPKLVQGIKYFLDDMKIKYGEFKTEKSGMFRGNVIRIPILKWSKTKGSPPLLNLTNDNARLIFHDLLQFPDEDGSYNFSPADLYRKIEMLGQFQLNTAARDPKISKNVYDAGLSSEGIAERLEQLKKIAKWALDNHYDSINVE